jgi:hypothetical protein
LPTERVTVAVSAFPEANLEEIVETLNQKVSS